MRRARIVVTAEYTSRVTRGCRVNEDLPDLNFQSNAQQKPDSHQSTILSRYLRVAHFICRQFRSLGGKGPLALRCIGSSA
jgi:hypothetical protein